MSAIYRDTDIPDAINCVPTNKTKGKPHMPTTNYTQRRTNLATSLQNGDLAIIFATDTPHGITTFTQNKNFLYLTGLHDLPEAIYITYKTADKINEALYIQRNIPERIVWDGEKMYPDEARTISEIQTVKYLDEWELDLPAILSQSKNIYANYGTPTLHKPPNTALYKLQNIKDRFLHLSFADITEQMIPLRQIKDDSEIALMTEAIEVTGKGLHSIFTQAKAGMYEYELEAMLGYEMRRRGIAGYGFAPIIAAGKNATTLHYIQNNTKIAESELVLCDVGVAVGGYSADITRTFPIGSTFTSRQREVYTEVLACQKTIISMMAPGVSMVDLNAKTAELIGASCVKLGLINDPADFRKHYMHSIGHHLGLDTHDIGLRSSTLQEGMVITCEPGIYIPEESIGIRIEDDVLITSSGNIVLSHMIPKEIDEIEAIRKGCLQ